MGETNVTTQFGGINLQVPCVQELAKESLTTVPPRYVRFVEQHTNTNPIFSDQSPQVPVIDMQRLLSGVFMDSELLKLHQACKEWGFFQLTNHKVSSSLVDKVKSEIEEFFKLPMEEKKKYWQEPGGTEGFGNAFVVSEDQKLDWGDMFHMTSLPTHLRKSHLFPKLPLPFRETLETYSAEMKNLAMIILNKMAKALKMEANDMEVLFEKGWQAFRMNYYPPCPQPELVMGLTPHSDAVGLTILLQVNDVQGLQIKKDGMWIPIKPLSNAFIINIGDILEIVTNGTYPSIEHRATIDSEKERISIATFLSPRLDGDMGPAPSLIAPESPEMFRRISVRDFMKVLFSRKLDGKSCVELMRINQNEKGSNI